MLKGEKRLEWNTTLLDGVLTSKFLPVYQSYGPDYLQPLFPCSDNRFNSGLPGRDHIVHYQHLVLALNVALNIFFQAMLFGFLSHDESAYILAGPVRGIRNGDCERIR